MRLIVSHETLVTELREVQVSAHWTPNAKSQLPKIRVPIMRIIEVDYVV